MNFKLESHLQHHLHLFPDCIAVRGAKRSAIYDLTRGDIVVFGSDYLDLLRALMQHRLEDILRAAEESGKLSDCTEFLALLCDNEFIFFAPHPAFVSKMPEERRTACNIENAIVDCCETIHDFKSIFAQLDCVGCQFIEIRCFSTILTPPVVRSFIGHAYNTSIRGVELILKSDPNYHEEDYVDLLEREPIISRLTVHSSAIAKQVSIDLGDEYLSTRKGQLAQINFVKQEITSEWHCGVISEGSFWKPTPATFFTNKTANGCLNQKISIDSSGQLRNCPSMGIAYGNIKNTELLTVMNRTDFRAFWSITKDQIETCKDCEFRYACSDCRAYLDFPALITSKPLKCGYDPYTAQWADWASSPFKKAAIEYYRDAHRTKYGYISNLPK